MADGETGGGNERTDAALVESALDTLQDIFFVFDLDGTFLQWNSRLTAVTGYTDEAVAEMHPTDFIAEDDVDDVATAIATAIDTGEAQVDAAFSTVDGETIPYEFTGSLLRGSDGEPLAICGIGRDISDRLERERALEHQAERLETLNQVNAVIRDVNSALVRASSREEVEQAVCEHLVSDTPYRFAWIGEIDLAGRDVEPRAAAGDGGDYLEERLSGETRPEDVTAATAIQEGCTLVSGDITETEDGNPWREAAMNLGYQSAAAIPLHYRDTTYGVLCLYAPRANAFAETERAVLDELGETVGYALSTVEQRRALVSDTVVELELGVSEGVFFVDASRELDCTLSLEGVTQDPDGDLTEFLTVRGAAADEVVALASERGGSGTVVTEYDDTSVVRVTVPELSLPALVADRGGVLQHAEANSGAGMVRVELPQGSDIRSAVESFQARLPSIEVLAQRERERTSTRGLEFRDKFADALTDRQREVLETAHLAGYFEWPRGSTAEEIAETIGISPPTFHEHIRRIQQKLLGAFLETNPPTAR